MPKRKPLRGTASVETAICLPIATLLLLGTLESTSMIHLRKSLVITAYEAARTSVIPGARETDVQAAANQMLADRQVTGSTVNVTPSNFETAAVGDLIRIDVTAPCDPNAFLPTVFFRGQTIQVTAQAMKEY